jgi:hypothetical protein
MGFLHAMSFRARAFATLAAVGVLVLTAAFLSGAVLGSRQLLSAQGKAEARLQARSSAWKTVGLLLSALQGTWNAEDETIDAWWAEHSRAFPSVSELFSLSSRVNLNSLSPFLLKHSELQATLRDRSVEDFVSYRASKGPFALVDDYREYFKPEALGALYCAHSSFNVNTADEIVLEKILAIRTGSESLAATIRTRLREYRSKRQTVTEDDWGILVGAAKETIGDLATTAPELDVNTAEPSLLQAILRYPDFKLEKADEKLQTIVTGRASKPWTDDTLRQALGVGEKSPLLQYLGTRSRYLQGRVTAGSWGMRFVAVVSYSTDSPPKLGIRVLEARWTSL